MNRGPGLFRTLFLCFGFAFLYVPIILLVTYSFNASRLVTVWAGFSTHWYLALLENQQLVASALISLQVAVSSAFLATLFGTCAAIALVSFKVFPGRLLFGLMIYAPLVMPEVITGLSLLLLFVALDIPRGLPTLIAGHATVGMCFVTVVVQARLSGLNRSYEEAAMDLGARRATVLWRITLPMALPSIVAGYLLAFTLSLDDFVVASFTSGPGSTTLPMRIYSAVRLGVTPEINAISTVMIVTVGVALLVYALINRWRVIA